MSNLQILLVSVLIWSILGVIITAVFEPPKEKLKLYVSLLMLGPVMWVALVCLWVIYFKKSR